MREFALPLAAVSTESSREVSSVQNKRQRWLAALLASSLSGIFVGIAGLIISGLSLINIAEKTGRAQSNRDLDDSRRISFTDD